MNQSTTDLDEKRRYNALDFTWDVRNHVPRHTSTELPYADDPYDENDREVQKVYNRINMMTFLLEDIPFDVFLGAPICNWIDHSIYKVAHQGRWPGRVEPPDPQNTTPPYTRASPRHNYHPHRPEYYDFPNDPADPHESDLRVQIYNTLVEIKGHAEEDANGHPPVRMRHLWETNVKADATDQRLKDIYGQLYDDWYDKAIGFRFCLPFIRLQEANPPMLVPAVAMNSFIDSMRGVTHRDAFTRSVKFFPRIKTGVDFGKHYGIFERTTASTEAERLFPRGGGGPNNRVCDANLGTCITLEDHHCTTDSNGLCTSG